MEETISTAQQGTQTAETQPEKTFTQAELDAVVGDRLKRERAKYADYEDLKAKAAQYDAVQEAGKSELQKAQEQAAGYKAELDALKKDIEARNARDKVAAETGVPASLLTAETEDDCKKQAEAILKWRGDAPKYPETRDAGEVTQVSGGKTRDQFADWFKTMTT